MQYFYWSNGKAKLIVVLIIQNENNLNLNNPGRLHRKNLKSLKTT